MKKKVCIIGGAGHVGFPLGLMIASKNNQVFFYDKNEKACDLINKNIAPYYEINSEKYLKKYKKNLIAGNNDRFITNANIIIICIGTPVKKNTKPDLKEFFKLIKKLKNLINKKQLIIIRSSVYPGTIEKIKNLLKHKNSNISYCPERILQGSALVELNTLPQVISGINKKSIKNSVVFFKSFVEEIIISSVIEAELIKLFSNAWRYINFAASNQFYNICQKFEINFNELRKKMMKNYSRNQSLPLAGFAAGPCLVKDTMQLVNLTNNKFTMGKASLKINEDFPNFLIKELERKFILKKKKIGILGIAFKSDVDDTRDSLSIKLIKILKRKKIKFFISDDYVNYPNKISKKELIKKSDIIIIATPHKNYKKLTISKNKTIVDTWGILKK
tara:strand:- start:118 stop:1284 length:1167 start_codon:yes stop_codon:yes gene_type:complete